MGHAQPREEEEDDFDDFEERLLQDPDGDFSPKRVFPKPRSRHTSPMQVDAEVQSLMQALDGYFLGSDSGSDEEQEQAAVPDDSNDGEGDNVSEDEDSVEDEIEEDDDNAEDNEDAIEDNEKDELEEDDEDELDDDEDDVPIVALAGRQSGSENESSEAEENTLAVVAKKKFKGKMLATPPPLSAQSSEDDSGSDSDSESPSQTHAALQALADRSGKGKSTQAASNAGKSVSVPPRKSPADLESAMRGAHTSHGQPVLVRLAHAERSALRRQRKLLLSCFHLRRGYKVGVYFVGRGSRVADARKSW